jgi:hypothetical protein
VTAYPNHVEAEGVGLGAAVLKEAEVKQHIVAELGREYLVVEVAVYPKDGADLAVRSDLFALRVGDQERVIRSENPKVTAASIQKAEESRRDILIIPQVGVGYETGNGRYDPTTGRRTGGVYTSTGVAVIVGPPFPGPNPKNEEVMALELSEKGLPDGTFSKPIAGHLYFRVGKEVTKDSNSKYELTYELNGKQGVLPLKR